MLAVGLTPRVVVGLGWMSRSGVGVAVSGCGERVTVDARGDAVGVWAAVRVAWATDGVGSAALVDEDAPGGVHTVLGRSSN